MCTPHSVCTLCPAQCNVSLTVRDEGSLNGVYFRVRQPVEVQVGDQYLARIFDLASTRFHLRGWEQNIRRKLDTVGDVFDLLIQQAGSTRTVVLEIVVIVLIATEIILALFRH